MQFNISTDYAIRIVLYLAMNRTRERVSSGELFRSLGIPQSMVLKLGKRLKDENLVEITAGVNGGFKLSRTPEQITMYEVINSFEPTTKINHCLEDGECCNCWVGNNCPIKGEYSEIQMFIDQRLKSMTISELMERYQYA